MRTLLLLAVCLVAAVPARAADRLTLQSLVGREFLIYDDVAGQALAFKSRGETIYVIWRILGSGIPVVSEVEYPVEVKSPWQCVFEVQLRDKSRSKVKVGIGDGTEVLVYLNGVRIVFYEKKPNQSLQPTAPSGRG